MIKDIEKLMNYSEKNNENSKERALRIIAYLEDRGLSLFDNGWLDDEPEHIVEKIENYYQSNENILE